MHTLRSAHPADIDQIVPLHMRVWRETYRDLAPPEVARALDEAARRRRWTEILATDSTILAVDGETILGFAQVGPPSHPALGARGEVKHLFVDTASARRGIGRALLQAARDRLAERSFPSIALGVVVGNEGALLFYQAEGGRVVGRYRDPGPLWPSDNLIVAWDAPGAGAA